MRMWTQEVWELYGGALGRGFVGGECADGGVIEVDGESIGEQDDKLGLREEYGTRSEWMDGLGKR